MLTPARPNQVLLVNDTSQQSDESISHHREMDGMVDVDDAEDDILDAQFVDGQPLRFRFSWRKLWLFVRCRL